MQRRASKRWAVGGTSTSIDAGEASTAGGCSDQDIGGREAGPAVEAKIGRHPDPVRREREDRHARRYARATIVAASGAAADMSAITMLVRTEARLTAKAGEAAIARAVA